MLGIAARIRRSIFGSSKFQVHQDLISIICLMSCHLCLMLFVCNMCKRLPNPPQLWPQIRDSSVDVALKQGWNEEDCFVPD